MMHHDDTLDTKQDVRISSLSKKITNTLLNRVIVLGAGQPYQGEQHTALRGASKQGRVLDWILHAVRPLHPEIYFVGGYQIEEIAQRYPGFHYIVNPEWQDTGAAASFLQAPLDDHFNYFVSYADILFHDSAVNQLAEIDADIVVAADTRWRKRFFGRTDKDLIRCEKLNLHGNNVTRLGPDIEPDLAEAEFIGLAKFSARVIHYLHENSKDLLHRFRHANLSQLIEVLRMRGFNVRAVDVAGDWAELNEGQDLVHFVLGTKAQTLHRLRDLVTKSRIEDQVSFTVVEWQQQAKKILEQIYAAFSNQHLVVRSSALSEDGFATANAGAYTSVLNVSANDARSLQKAVESVIASYPDDNLANQVLVQPMVLNVKASGVAFTRTLAYGAPYFVINYDDSSKSTESITSGSSQEHKTLILHRNYSYQNENLPPEMHNLIPALVEIEELLEYDSLDIEFAISEEDCVHILQVRPIAVNHAQWNITDKEVESFINVAQERFQALQASSPFIVGKKAFFGIMPDWNPAEIIGTNPGCLALGLYRYLIMDDVWATQRAQFGYRDVRPQPLLITFAGHPYVDIRASFNSFIPAELDNELAARLVDFYLNWLELHPHLHDKVEFDVVPTCYDLNFKRWEKRLTQQGQFSAHEINQLKQALKQLTQKALANNKLYFSAIENLQLRRKQILDKKLPALERAILLLEDCKHFGTLSFAHLARNAFVAISLLKSAVETNIISQEAMNAFLSSIRTVSHSLTDDAKSTALKQLTWEEFVERYAHLRPGTYDITSPSYKEDAEHFLRPIVEKAEEHHSPKQIDLCAWNTERERFARALMEAEIDANIEQMEIFMRDAIEGREYAKFIFSRNLSFALDELAAFGKNLGLSREELSNIPLDAFFALRTGSVITGNVSEWLRARAGEGSSARQISSAVELPPLLLNPQDLHLFMYPNNQPNYIGSSRVTADLFNLDKINLLSTELHANLAGKIAMIPQADPGYDWVFGQGIVGLITMYGGANSHMAIRSAEFGLPAAIGIGETVYQRLAGASTLELNAGNRQIRIIR
ncbi:PEP/pyruvate-binding domain-containing protein [Legionella septentrionalis]|uniref:PEP/pyruvate-binding domain-containing protein n=1 Tax=Legionella septentrionalis TaxID=2498109 RepID=UPI0018F4963F|nr:PEP/pyruvate-binding domain-containing protein [Legionella septentrionalis]